jgi:type III secretion protein U
MYLQMTMDAIIKTSAPILIMVAAVGVLTNFLIVGPVFSMEALKFDLKKLNPIEGIKQKFKLKVLVELIKSCLKITAAAIIIYLIIKKALPKIISTVAFPPIIATHIVGDFLIDVTIQVGVFFLLIAMFDLFFQKAQFAKDMKMEKFEVKQEYKDTEGDPQIKGKRREMFREIAYQEGPTGTKRARAVITNPTHYAIAIKYNPQEEKVPVIVTMGAGEMASQIIKIAIDYKIPIMRNPDLARTLYTKGRISHYVPEETYGALIEVLKWLRALERNPDMNKELLQ